MTDTDHTNEYECWHHSRRDLPREVIRAPGSFWARTEYAKRHGVLYLDCIARRIWRTLEEH
jgi:hypothetical protein